MQTKQTKRNKLSHLYEILSVYYQNQDNFFSFLNIVLNVSFALLFSFLTLLLTDAWKFKVKQCYINKQIIVKQTRQTQLSARSVLAHQKQCNMAAVSAAKTTLRDLYNLIVMPVYSHKWHLYFLCSVICAKNEVTSGDLIAATLMCQW